MDFAFFAPWHDVLPREAGHVVAFAGGAGKAGLIDLVAGIYAAEGVGVARAGPGGADPGDGMLVLADADGAASTLLRCGRRSLPWPVRTSLAVLEVSAAAVGGRADAAYDPTGLPPGLEPWTVLVWEHLELEVKALLAGLPPEVPAVLALTGLEAQPDSIGLFACTGRLMAAPPLAVVLFCSAAADGLSIRACCRAQGD